MSTETQRRRQRTFAPRLAPPAAVRPRPTHASARPPPRPVLDPSALRPSEPGRPLEPEVRRRLEAALDRPLAHVRVHTEPADRERTRALGARAFAHRHHIWLGPHESPSDVGLLAHEVTHVAQQGFAPHRTPALRATPAPVAIPAGAAHRAAAPRGARGVPAAPAARPAVAAVQKWDVDVFGSARRAAGSVASGIRSTGRAVVSGARAVGGAIAETGEALLARGRTAVMAVVHRVAPDFARLFERDGITGFLRTLIERGLRSMFDGLLGPLRGILNFGAIGERVSRAVSWIGTVSGQLSRRGCDAILTAARRVGEFFSSALGPVVDRIRGIADRVKGFFQSIWEAIGAPIMDILRSIGGRIWESLKGFVRDVAAVIRRVKDAIGSAWARVKGWFGIGAEEGTEEGGGLWEWIKGKARSIGDSISRAVRPVIGPLRTVGGVLLMIVPGGQILIVIRLWPQLRQAWGWLTRWWSDLNLIPRARNFLANTVLPALMDAAVAVGQALVGAADWLLGLVERVSGALATALRAATGILSPLGILIGFAHQQFRRLLNWVRSGLRWASRNMRMLMQKLVEFLGFLLQVMQRLIAIALNPFGIVGFLAGTLWRLVPNCLKGPLINFILDVIIRFLRVLPPMPHLGLLWPLIKSAALGFLERVRSFSIERKVNVSNKMARIVSGMSPTFVFGYLYGLVGGVFGAIIAPFQGIAAIFELPDLIRSFLSQLGVRMCELIESIRCFAANLFGRVIGGLDDIISGLGQLLENPMQIIDLIRCAIEGVLASARSVGATIASRMMEIFEGPEDAMGEMLGNITGHALVNVVITYFTAGVGTGAAIAGRVAALLGRAGRVLGQVVRMAGQVLRQLVGWIRGFAAKFASGAASAARGVLGRIGAFFRRVAAWFGKLLRRIGASVRRRFGLSPAQRMQWLAFRGTLRGTLRLQQGGITRANLRGVYRGVLQRYPTVAKRPAYITKHGPHWRLWVRRVKSVLPRRVGRVLLDPHTRVGAAMREVKRRVKRLKRQPDNISSGDIRGVFGRVEQRYRLRSLAVTFNPASDDYRITAIANPRKDWKTRPKRPKENVINPAIPGRKVIADPLVKNRLLKSAARGTTALWSAIRTIRSFPGGEVSLYVRGHLVSGWFASGGPSNWTPITRQANEQMEKQMEDPIWRELLPWKRNRPVFKYEVEAVGRAQGATLPERKIRGRWTTMPTERLLARTITMRLTRYHYDDSAERWTRVGRTTNRAVVNVPEFPKGKDEPPRRR